MWLGAVMRMWGDVGGADLKSSKLFCGNYR